MLRPGNPPASQVVADVRSRCQEDGDAQEEVVRLPTSRLSVGPQNPRICFEVEPATDVTVDGR